MRSALLLGLLTACGSRTGLSADQRLHDMGDSSSETCNGIDDDRDGEIDEGIADLQCGIGACTNVVPGCVNGAVPVCTGKNDLKRQ